jgi:hypothetical protein
MCAIHTPVGSIYICYLVDAPALGLKLLVVVVIKQ